MIDLVWFKGVRWIKDAIKINEEIQIYGKATQFKGKWNIPHPELSALTQEEATGLQPVYSSTERLNTNGFNSKGLERLLKNLLEQLKGQIEERFPPAMMAEHRLISREQAILWVHRPSNELEAQQARFRLKFEELFFLQLELLVRKHITMQKSKGYRLDRVGEIFLEFYEKYIPFELTGAQKRVLKEIRRDVGSGQHMNRLLQGDVGSGKTLVALLTMLLAAGNGFQAALMAPT